MRCDEHIYEDIDNIRHIPATIVQGRYDVVCPAESAWKLHKVCCFIVAVTEPVIVTLQEYVI